MFFSQHLHKEYTPKYLGKDKKPRDIGKSSPKLPSHVALLSRP